MSSLIMGRKLLETWEKMHHNNNKIPQTQIIRPFHLKESKNLENNNTTCTHFHTQFYTLLICAIVSVFLFFIFIFITHTHTHTHIYIKDGPCKLEWTESVHYS